MLSLEEIGKRLSRWFSWVGGAALLALTGVSCLNMILRPMGAPLKGVYELAGFFGALAIALSLGYSQITNSHIAVDILATRYSKRTQRVMNAINSLLCTIFFVLVAWQVTVLATTIWRRGETSESMRLTYHPVVYVVAIGCFLFALIIFVGFLRSITPGKGVR